MRVKIYLFPLILLFSNYQISNALMISEINFKPSNTSLESEYVEIFNEKESIQNIEEYFFAESSQQILLKTEDSNKNFNTGEFAVIVDDKIKFKNKFPNYNGKIFVESLTLSNSGENLSLLDKNKNILHTLNYSENFNGTKLYNLTKNGESLHFDGQIFFSAALSPGSENIDIAKINLNLLTTSTSTNSNINASSTQSVSTSTGSDSVFNPIYNVRSYWPDTEKIYVKAGENFVVLAGQSFILNPQVLDNNKKNISNSITENQNLKFKWNFGDGYESSDKNPRHSYSNLGEYVINLNVNYNGIVESDKFYVKVLEPQIKIKIITKNIKNILEQFVEIRNENNTEIDVGGLILQNEYSETFVLPSNFSILGKRAIFLDPGLIKFATNTNEISLQYPDKTVLDHFILNNKIINKKFDSASASRASTSPVVFVFTKEQFLQRNKNIAATTSRIVVKPRPNIVPKKILPNQLKNISVENEKVKEDENKIIFTKTQNPGFYNKIRNFLNF